MKKKYQARPIRTVLLSLAVLPFILSAISCQNQELKVYLEIKLPDRIDFSSYKTLLFNPLVVSGLPEGLGSDHIQEDFFLGDLPRQNKLSPHKTSLPSSDPEQPDATALSELATKHEKALLITGKMDVSTKSHSMVRERRDERIGKRIRSIVKLNQMILKMDLFVYSADSGKLLWKKSYTQQENEYPGEREAFTFRSLFYKITDRFSRDIGLQERRVRRTLLEE